MFSVESYINNPKCKIYKIDHDICKCFVNVNDHENILKIIKYLDLNYLSGAILLKFYDETILDFKHWDLIDQLWSYMIDLIEETIITGQSEIYFPDQPIKLQVKSISEQYLVFSLTTSSCSKWTLPKKEFFIEILNGAECFFGKIFFYFNSANSFEVELKKIYKLKCKII